MNNLFDLLIIILLGGVSLLAFFAVAVLLLPEPITKVQKTLENAGGKSILLGLVNFVFGSVLVLLFIWLGERFGGVIAAISAIISVLIAAILAVFTAVGLIAFAQLLGVRSGKESTPSITIIRGGGLMLLAGLAPYIGWFLFTPLAVWAGIGAAISTFIKRREKPSSVEAAV